MSSNEKSKTIIQLLSEYGYEETYDNEIPHYVHYNISQENALRAFKEWLEQKKLNSPTMNAILRKYCNRAGVYRWKTVVDKKTGEARKENAITLHYLRHSKVTWTATNKLREVNIVLANDMFGWSKASTTYARYTHITGKDRVDAFLELAGSKKVERKEEEDALRLKKCLGCGMENSIGSLYCAACGCVLDEAQARVQAEKQKMMDWLMKKFLEEQEKESKDT